MDGDSTPFRPAGRAATIFGVDAAPLARVAALAARGTPAEGRWWSLLLMTRLLGAAVAVALLLAHRVTDADVPLAVAGAAWAGITLLAFARSSRLRASPWAWGADAAGALGLVLLSGDWRSPFYLFALTTLVLPATTLGWRAALAWGWGFAVAYAAVAVLTRQLPADTIQNTIRLETLATHTLVPVLITLALAFAGRLLRELHEERERAQSLAVQAERQRLAWELHDSAKQRVHAAHLLVSALPATAGSPAGQAMVEQALVELRAATADMETSIAQLRAPVADRPLEALLAERARELAVAGTASIEVRGQLGPLPEHVAAHAYRVAAEAMANAVRHAGGTRIEVELADGPGGRRVLVRDDGVGHDARGWLAGQGLRTMRGRAEAIGAELSIDTCPEGGTCVVLSLPDPEGAPA